MRVPWVHSDEYEAFTSRTAKILPGMRSKTCWMVCGGLLQHSSGRNSYSSLRDVVKTRSRCCYLLCSPHSRISHTDSLMSKSHECQSNRRLLTNIILEHRNIYRKDHAAQSAYHLIKLPHICWLLYNPEKPMSFARWLPIPLWVIHHI